MGSSVSKAKAAIIPKSNQVQNVHCIVEGTGGVFHLRDVSQPGRQSKPIHESIRGFDRDELVGVEQCDVGVGVYFKIGGDMFFCAHMHFTTGGPPFYVPEGTQSADIANIVVGMLEGLRKDQGWKLEDINKNSLLMVCPLEELGGKAVARGVCQFIDRRMNWRKFLNTEHHGFVIEPGYSNDKRLMVIDREWLHTGEVEDIKKYSKPLAGYKMNRYKLPKNEWRWVHRAGRNRKRN